MRNVVFGLAFFSVLLGLRAAQAKYSGGTGELNNPYRIATPNDLNDIGNHVEDFNKCFVMVNDVNLAAYTGGQFNIIGDSLNGFYGIFDGNNHTVSNFTLTLTDLQRARALFGYTESGAVIKNLNVENAYVNVPAGNRIAVIHGEGSAEIINCSASGTVIGEYYVGGISGQTYDQLRGCKSSCIINVIAKGGGITGQNNGTITNCYATGDISGADDVGGIVGYNSGTISNCFSSGFVAGTSYGAGGCVGSNDHSAVIHDCYAVGDVESDQMVGGFVGSGGAVISNCYAVGSVTGNTYVGAFVGYNASISYKSNFWDSNINPDMNGIGTGSDPNVIGLTTAEMQMHGTFESAGWDFNDVWAICDGTNYPRHIWSIPAADFVCPDGVNFVDYSYFAPQWLASDCNEANGYCSGRDLDESGLIDEEDLKILCGYWLDGI